ncbi:MAG: hypothetical protein F6K65_24935 [Moorea sp. SIO3C2]|nr:hypothetical protein [Moorena sp. SIO3C2]
MIQIILEHNGSQFSDTLGLVVVGNSRSETLRDYSETRFAIARQGYCTPPASRHKRLAETRPRFYKLARNIFVEFKAAKTDIINSTMQHHEDSLV